MPELALWLWSVYGVLALGVRIALHLRRTGSTGFKGASGRPGSKEWFAGVGLVTAIPAGVAAPLLDLWDAVEPLQPLDNGVVQTVGVVLYCVAMSVLVAAQRQMGTSWRIGVDERERTTLVTGGLFALVRNPIFSAMIAVSIGLGLLVPNALSLVSVILLVASIEVQTRLVEEPYLVRVHGYAYLSYGRRVGRFVPGLGRLA
jgi:protein-S-isoprenylcysteine O-methyltransferase Ste14